MYDCSHLNCQYDGQYDNDTRVVTTRPLDLVMYDGRAGQSTTRACAHCPVMLVVARPFRLSPYS